MIITYEQYFKRLKSKSFPKELLLAHGLDLKTMKEKIVFNMVYVCMELLPFLPKIKSKSTSTSFLKSFFEDTFGYISQDLCDIAVVLSGLPSKVEIKYTKKPKGLVKVKTNISRHKVRYGIKKNPNIYTNYPLFGYEKAEKIGMPYHSWLYLRNIMKEFNFTSGKHFNEKTPIQMTEEEKKEWEEWLSNPKKRLMTY